MNKIWILILGVLLFCGAPDANAQVVTGMSSGEIQQSLRKLNTLGSVLYVAAHPDDENTRLLSYLANERNFRTVYLSITRGDGGQNLIGKEQGEELGMIRTRELLEARKTDGAEQFFTRANDFGFSKNPEESFRIWNKDAILADVVLAIRKFQPDVIINRFPTTGEGGHGHHTASAMLALEAFRAAADPLRFPEQLKDVSTWQARRIFLNSFNPRGQPQQDFSGQLKLDVGGYNPLLGVSYGEMAAASRSMHKSQGFGVAVNRGTTFEYFKKLDGDTAVSEIFEGINTNWSREAFGPLLPVTIRKAQAEFDESHPEKTIPVLFDILNQIRKLEDSYWKQVKEKEVMQLIAGCAGLWMEVNAGNYYGIPGDSFSFTYSIISRSLPGVVFEKISIHDWDTIPEKTLTLNEMSVFSKVLILDKNSSYSNPYWLNKPHEPGLYTIEDSTKTGQPWNNSWPEASVTLTINGQSLTYPVPVTHKWTDPVRGERYRPFEILPPVSINPEEDILIFKGPETRSFRVKVKSLANSFSGTIKVQVPSGWIITPESAVVSLTKNETEKFYDFLITPPGTINDSMVSGSAVEIFIESGKKRFEHRVSEINYDHIPPLVRLSRSSSKLITLELKSKIKKIGYIQGAGDDVGRCLKQAGFDVTILNDQNIMEESLSQYDAILTGIRAYNTLQNMDAWYQPLMQYVENGGNLVVQYNTNNFLSNIHSPIGPYPFKITRDRVTVENASVQFDDPDHFLLNTPNKITQADFDGWVQERGLYFAGDLAHEYKTILSMYDPGEKPGKGSLIIAKKGKGYFIYTGISFFRQLPAGVPGAYRLLVNLLNAGK